MASARPARRLLPRLTRPAPLGPASCSIPGPSALQSFRQAPRRSFADGSGPNPSRNTSTLLYTTLGFAAAGGAGLFIYRSGNNDTSTSGSIPDNARSSKTPLPSTFTPKFEDYQEVYNEVADRLVEFDDYDDGSYGPVVLRLGWHASGTYDVATGTGGSNGATMRFAPEGDHGANAGLKAARDFLQPVKEKYPWITYSDLWTLAAVCAIQEMSGPAVLWRPGRADRDASWCTPDGRLPDGTKGQDHLRAIFGRMGFNDQEIVALSGAHALGRCHADRSGFDGPWTFSPITMTNDYYKLLLDEKWTWRKWNGQPQYEDVGTKTLMMLPTDMALVHDKSFRPWVELYAKDADRCFDDFGKALCKLFELGVPFTTGEDSRYRFKSTAEE